jgi:protein-disulfide isomerase
VQNVCFDRRRLFKSIGLYVWLFLAPSGLAEESAPGNAVVATVDGETILAADVDKLIGARVAQLKGQIYQLQRQTVDGLIDQRLIAKEAARRGMSETQLLDLEVAQKTGSVTDAEVEVFYQANESRLPTKEADLRERIREHLRNQKAAARRVAFTGELRAAAQVNVLLTPPAIYRAKIDVDGAPFKGTADAPVVIVKFEDFHCPFCKEAQATMAQLLARYPDRIKIVHKDFPIDELHPGARAAHTAARCASEQGTFWPYHDALYAHAPKTAAKELESYAKDVGLDAMRLEQCVSAGKYSGAVGKDIDDGKQAGVTGTPAFFINGRLVAGAQPVENFVKIIDEELTSGH